MHQSPLRAPFEPVEVDGVSPNRRVLSKARTRARVLDAARVLFTERGYEAATIRDIARRAELSTGAVFANFEDKADLFEAVLLQDYEIVAERMRAAAAAPGDVSAKLLAVFAAGYEHHLENLPLLQAAVAQSWTRPLSHELKSRGALKILLGIVGEVLREGSATGQLRQELDVRLVVEMLWDSYLANYRRAAFDSWSLETLRARLAEQIALVVNGLRKV